MKAFSTRQSYQNFKAICAFQISSYSFINQNCLRVRQDRYFTTGSDDRKILDGMLVIEQATVLAGPSIGQFLGELGARVIKCEPPVRSGDMTRLWKLENDPEGSTVTAYFSSCNAGKQSIGLNLREQKGVELFYGLIEKADVFVSNFKPGDEMKLKVDFDTLSKLNPRLVYAQVTGYGLDSERLGYDAVVQGEAGFQFMNGTPDGPPCKMPVALIDVLSAHQLKEAILVSLWRREKTGKGAHVNVSLFHTGVASLMNQATGYLLRGKVPQRIGSDHPTIAPYGSVFETQKSGELMSLAVGNDTQFQTLCKFMEIPHLAESGSKFETNKSRCEHREELKGILQEKIRNWDRATLLDQLINVGVPCSSVNSMDDVFRSPLAQETILYDGESKADTEMYPHLRAFNAEYMPVGIRQITWKGSVEGLDVKENRSFSPPPEYGEHTDEILHEFFGYDDVKISALRKDKIVM